MSVVVVRSKAYFVCQPVQMRISSRTETQPASSCLRCPAPSVRARLRSGLAPEVGMVCVQGTTQRERSRGRERGIPAFCH